MTNNIFIISLSPAIDYILKFDQLKFNQTNRPQETELYPAGKGIHISMILNNLKIKNESIVFSSGDFEHFFYKGLKKVGVKYQKFAARGDIRINLKLIDHQQTECSIKSPSIELSELEKMKAYLKAKVLPNDYVIATGSLPEGVNSKIYGEIVQLTNSLKANCIIDAFGDALSYAIQQKPFLIKPNVEELSITTGIKIQNEKDILQAAQSLIKKGAKNILISRGEKGAIFVNENRILKCLIGNWNKPLVNAAGAGDSMLGGFLSEFIKTQDEVEALKMGIICGSATAYSNKIASSELISELAATKNQLKIENLK